MEARNVNRSQLEDAALSVGVVITDYRVTGTRVLRHNFVLRLDRTAKDREGKQRYQRMNHTHSRRVAAVCWHGHRDFFRALFKVAPDATISTARLRRDKIRYSADTFEEVFPETGYANIGSQFQPCNFQDACTCGE